MVAGPVRVLHVLPIDVARGAQAYARDVTAVLAAGPDEHRTLTIFTQPPAALTVDRPLGHPTGRLRGLGLDPSALRDLRGALADEAPDVVVAHGGEALKYVALGLGRRRPGGPALVYYKIGMSAADVAASHQRRLYRWLIGRCDLVAGVTTEVVAEAEQLFGPCAAVAVIPNARDERRYRPRPDGPSGAEPHVVWVGNLNAAKRPEWFLDLVASMRTAGRGVRASMVGDGPLEAVLAPAAAAAGVALLGRRHDVADLVAGADLLVFTSVTEGLPGVLIEAALCGVPVVTTDVPGARDIVVDGETGRVVGLHDRAALDAAVATLLDDPETRRRMGRAARAHALDHFTLTVAASRWQRVLDELVGRPTVAATASGSPRPAVDRSTRVRPALVATRQLADGTVAVARPEPGTDVVHLAGSGPSVWTALDGRRSLGEIAAELATRHQADPDVVATDVCATVERFLDLGLVEVAPGSAGCEGAGA